MSSSDNRFKSIHFSIHIVKKTSIEHLVTITHGHDHFVNLVVKRHYY